MKSESSNAPVIRKTYGISPKDVFETRMWERGPIPLSRWVIVVTLFSGVAALAFTELDPNTREFIFPGEFNHDLVLWYGSPVAIYALWPLIYVLWLKFTLRGVSQTEVNFQIDERGYTEFQDGLSFTPSWALLWQAVESDWYVWLKFTKTTHHLVFPKRHFSARECNDLRQIIRANTPHGARVVLHGFSRETDMPFGLAQ